MNTTTFCVIFILSFAFASPLKCYNCQDCAKYEGSQSVKCSDSATHCLKLHSVFDKVIRECGTQDTCEQKKMRTEAFKSVHCCKGDNCNKSVKAAPFWIFITMIFIGLKVIY